MKDFLLVENLECVVDGSVESSKLRGVVPSGGGTTKLRGCSYSWLGTVDSSTQISHKRTRLMLESN